MNDIIKEIDLYFLLKKGAFFILKHKWVVLIFLTIGLFVGLFQVKNNPDRYENYYQSYFFIESSLMPIETLHTFINNLNFVYDEQQGEKVFPELLSEIKELTPVKELSVDGLRSSLRVFVDIKSPQELSDIMNLTSHYIESTAYFKLKYSVKMKELNKVLLLIIDQFKLLGVDLNDENLASVLEELSQSNPQNYLAYVSLVEKKTTLENEIAVLKNSLVYIPVYPENKLIDTSRNKIITYLGYTSLSLCVGLVLLVIVDLFKKNN
jgi:cell division protein FtsB